MANVADLLARTLAEIGVSEVFGIVGDALNEFSEALRVTDGIDWIGVHHEEGAALAAAGQGKLTGRLGVCAGTTGPGANHLVAGLYEAKKDHAPVLAITGWVPAELRGIDYRQENTPNLLFRDVAVYTETITDASMAKQVIHQAISAAYGRRGVAHVNIPQDVMGQEVDGVTPSLPTLRPRNAVTPSEDDLAEAVRIIDEAGTIAVMCGTGCRGAEPLLLDLADRLEAPLIHTFRGADMVPYDHPRWIGGIGMIGGRPGVDTAKSADLLLMLGTDYPYGEWLPTHGNVIQVDERAEVLGRRTPVRLGIVGSVEPALRVLLDRVRARDDTTFFDQVTANRVDWNRQLDELADIGRSADVIHPQAVARTVSDLAADDAVFCTDTGLTTLWAANWTRPSGRQRFVGTFNNQSVGTALGMANGVQALDRNRQVIVHIGDGGFSMLLGEFLTAVGHDLPLKVVVYDNGEWGLVHQEMEQIGNPISPGANIRNPDFAALAQACGAYGAEVADPSQLTDAVRDFLATSGTALLCVKVDPADRPLLPEPDPETERLIEQAQAKEAEIGQPKAT